MSKLLPLLLICLILATLTHVFSVKNNNTGVYVKKGNLFWCVLAFVLICFAGLRIRYNDTAMYIHAYNLWMSTGLEASEISLEIGDNPGFHLLNLLMMKLKWSSQSFLMFYSALTIGIYLWFIRKYSNNLWLSIFLFIVASGYVLTLAAIKQCVAMAFAMVGVDRWLEGKRISFALWILLGTTFHPYALMYLITPFLMFCPWSGKTYLMIFAFFVIGISLQALMGTVINITTMLGEEYTASSFSGEGVNPFRLAVVAVPTLISFITQPVIRTKNDRTNNLFMNFTMLNATVMFVALFGTANYFGRLANYFTVFQTISMPWLLSQFDRKGRTVLTAVAMGCYLLYFYYQYSISGPFDQQYSAITLSEYLHSIF